MQFFQTRLLWKDKSYHPMASLKRDHFRPLFLYFRLSMLLTVNVQYKFNFADDWIRTVVLWCQKRQLYRAAPLKQHFIFGNCLRGKAAEIFLVSHFWQNWSWDLLENSRLAWIGSAWKSSAHVPPKKSPEVGTKSFPPLASFPWTFLQCFSKVMFI